MPFFESCITNAHTLARTTAERAILDYLLENAVGKNNAKSWDTISFALKDEHTLPTKEGFQMGLLARSRGSDAFIGSCPAGYFIINGLEDAFACLNFYLKRISVEQQRVESLRKLIESAYLG